MKITKQALVLFALVFTLAIGMATPTFARRGGDDQNVSTSNTSDDSDKTENETEVENEDETEDLSREDRVQKLNERIAERRAELEQKFEARKQKRQEKLEGKRLEVCEKRETRINELIQSSGEKAKKKLAVFQKIEEGVKNFYENKGLSAEGYDAAVENADAKEADAIAAIDAMIGLTFTCDDADGATPGAVIAAAAKARSDALKAYKTAVRELIVVVKQSLEATQASDDATEENSSSLDQEN